MQHLFIRSEGVLADLMCIRKNRFQHADTSNNGHALMLLHRAVNTYPDFNPVGTAATVLRP